MNYKADDRFNGDGRLIHRAVGVLDAASLVAALIPAHPAKSRARQSLEMIEMKLRDMAYEMRQHHNRLTRKSR